MTATILKLVPYEVGEGYRVEADAVLEGAKGKNWKRLLIVGELADEPEEDLYVAGNANAGETLILMELAKLQIIGAL